MSTTADSTHPTVLIAGATGWLGHKIAREVAASGARTRVGLRGGDQHAKAAELLTIDGIEVVELDLARPDTMPEAVSGVDVVVSAVQGGPELLVDGQAALAAAAYEAGVRRIFPSDFSADFSQIPAEDHLFFAWRLQAHEAITATGLAQTNLYNGAFAEMLAPQPMFVLIDWAESLVNYWGSPDQVYDFTATDDVARYVAAAAADPHAPDGPLRVAGDSRSPTQIAEAASNVSKKSFALNQLGTLEELTAEIQRRQADAPDDPFSWVGLQYFRSMATGAGQLHDLANGRYPSVRPATISTFLTEHRP